MKYCDHHGGGTVDEIREFNSPFELAEYLRKKLWHYYVEVNFKNIAWGLYTQDGDPRRGWKELWIVSVEGYGVCGWADSWTFEEKPR